MFLNNDCTIARENLHLFPYAAFELSYIYILIIEPSLTTVSVSESDTRENATNMLVA